MVVTRRRVASQEIYDAVALFTTAMIDVSSVLMPSRPVWSSEVFAELDQRFVQNPDLGSRNFLEKLADQLRGASDEAVLLMAELLTLHLLIPMNIRAERKRELVSKVLSWARLDVTVPEVVNLAFDHGFVRPGTYYLTRRDVQLACLVNFGQAVSALSSDERAVLLREPGRFKQVVTKLAPSSAYTQRNALLHLFHPRSFEAIVSREHKALIAKRWGHLVSEPTSDVDEQLAQIRAALEPDYGEEFDFYAEAVTPLWRARGTAWGTWVKWATRIAEQQDLDGEERQYKLDASAGFRALREDAGSDEAEWARTLRQALAKSGNLVAWQVTRQFGDWAADNPGDARDAIRALWDDTRDLAERIDGFFGAVPLAVLNRAGTGLSLASLLLMAADPVTFPPYAATAFKKAFDLTETTFPDEATDPSRRYSHALDWLDTFLDEAATRKLILRDRLDAQTLVWRMAKSDPPANWPAAERAEFLRWRGDEIAEDVAPQSLAEQLHLPVSFLEEVEALWADKKQLVLHGPPGTGKTFLARHLARQVAGEDGMVELVQFHPSYAYEDFVEGHRPNQEGTGFTLHEGPLKKLAEVARNNPEATHVLVIDELNRGNVAKLFGELYFLLEYRDQPIRLQYSEREFRLPANLRVIATMNTADRSVSLIDAALRRRFYFVELTPGKPPIDQLLATWLAANRPEMGWVADLVAYANQRLQTYGRPIGPSFFLRPDFNEQWLQRVWKHSVLPYLSEVLEPDELDQFELRTLQASLQHDEPGHVANP